MTLSLALDPVVSTIALAATSIVTLIGALAKALRLHAFKRSVAGFGLLPQALVAPVAAGIPAFEVVAVLAFLLPATRFSGAAALVVLFAAFALALAVNVARGHTDIDCGCSGFVTSTREVPHAIGWTHVARTLFLALLAASAWMPQTARDIVWIDYLTVLAGTLITVAVLLTLDVLLANRPKLKHLRNS
ncbi:MauE/DoxX family redox-associated membrane protein [Paraburkholderia saeva]|uniref:Methylamine utilization protein MauE n=1 Tax=Paraburkholderia saeva TaxID=2777537 RepID=A0A9N8RY10_9BURK|nr:MauE/DoxX family redox-associated membrane protein [Paraburkholderia saeva]CAG4906099.1 hypothetical protein R52603_03389 [Paraburkholderia saeva]CAG4910057.1 hypothetical protein LMG31841_03931 [Paraburkholderia saeva]